MSAKGLNHLIHGDIDRRIRHRVSTSLAHSVAVLSENIDILADRIGRESESVDQIINYVPVHLLQNTAFELVEDGFPMFWDTGGTADGRLYTMDYSEYIYGSRSIRLTIENNTEPGTAFISQEAIVGGSTEYTLSFFYNYNSFDTTPFARIIGKDFADNVIYDVTHEANPIRKDYWRRVEFQFSQVPLEVEQMEVRIGFSTEEVGLIGASMWIDGVTFDSGGVRNVFSELQAGIVTSELIQSNEIEARHIQAEAIETHHLKAGSIETYHISTLGLDAETIKTGTILINENLTLASSDGNVKIHSIAPDPQDPLSGGGRISIYNAISQEIIAIGHLDGSDYGMRVMDGLDNTIFLVNKDGLVKMANEAVTVDETGIYHGDSFDHTDSNFGIGVDGSVYIKGHLQAKTGAVTGLFTVGDYIALRGSSNIIGVSSTVEHNKLVVGETDGVQKQWGIPYSPVVPGTVTVFLDGVQADGYQVDYELAFFEFDDAPAEGKEVSVDFISVHEDVIKIGEYELNKAGMIVSSVLDSDKKILVDHRGLLFSEDAGETWVTALSGDGINATAITTGTLNADIVNVVNLDASNIKTGTLDAEVISVINLDASNITTGTLDADVVSVINLDASNIVTGTLDASIIDVINLTADLIAAGTIQISDSLSLVSDAGGDNSLVIDHTGLRVIDALNADKILLVDSQGIRISQDGGSSWDLAITQDGINASAINAGTIDADNVNVINLKAESIVSGDIATELLVANVINAINAEVQSATIDSARIGELSASKITSGDIATDRLIANVILAINSEFQQATINEARIADLSAEKIKTGDLSADIMQANVIEAINAYIGEAVIESAKIEDLHASKITAGDIETERLIANVISAINSEFQLAVIDEARIGNLSAEKITTGSLAAEVMEANVISAINAYIGQAVIDSAKIGDIHADKITAGDIATDRLIANVISAINSEFQLATINEARIGNLSAGKITTGDLSADRMKTNVISAINAYIGEAVIEGAKIGELSADQITTGSLSADVMIANVIEAINADIQVAKISGARIGNLSADLITSGEISTDILSANIVESINLYAGDAKIEAAKIADLDAGQITAGDIAADRIKTNVIAAINAYVGEAVIDAAKIADLNASKITAGDIDADRLSANVIAAINAYIGEATIDGAKIGELSAGQITAGDIATERLVAHVIDAINIETQSGVINEARIGELSAEKITSGDIATEVLVANVISAINSELQQATILEARIGDLSAEKITSGDIDTDRLQANVIAAINAYIGEAVIDGAKIGDLNANQITAGDIATDRISANVVDAINAYIGQAVIQEAKISDLSAAKITSGDIHADRMSANVVSAINLSAEQISTDRLSVTGIMEAINSDGSATRISGGKIFVQATGANQGFDLSDFFVVDNNITAIYGGSIATGTISTSQLSVEAFGNSDGLNLVPNASFIEDSNEDGVPDNWETETFLGSIERSIDTTEYRFNFKSVKMSAEMEASGTIISDPFEVEPDTVYVASGYVKLDAAEGDASLEVVFIYEDETTNAFQVAIVENDDKWHRYHALISTDTHEAAGQVTHVRFRCRVDSFVGDVWFDGIQFEKGALLTGFHPREMAETQIGPGIIRTHHISAVDFDASVITGGEFIVTESLTLRTSDDRVTLDDKGITVLGGALKFNSASDNSLSRLTLDDGGIKGYLDATTVGFHLKTDGTAVFNQSLSVSAGDVTINNQGITVSGSNAITVASGGYIFVGNADTDSGVRIDEHGVNVNDIVRLGNTVGGYGLELTTAGSMSLFMGSDGFSITSGQDEILIVTDSGDLTIKGTVYATDGEFTGTIKSQSGYFGTETDGVAIGSTGLLVVGSGAIVAGSVKIKEKTIEVDTDGDTDLVIGEYDTGKLGLKFGDTIFDSKDGITITGDAQIVLGDGGEFSVDSDGSLVATSANISGSITVSGASYFQDKVTIESGGFIVAGQVKIDHTSVVVTDDLDASQVKLGQFTFDNKTKYGILAGDAMLDGSGITIKGTSSSITLGPSGEFSVDGTGHLNTVSATFGSVINVDSTGVYHGSSLGHADSKFGIGTNGALYFKGTATIETGSIISGDISVGGSGKILAGVSGGKRFELTASGIFGYDSNNDEIFAVDTEDEQVRITAHDLNVKTGTILNTLYVGAPGADVRIGEGSKPVINMYHPAEPGHVIKLAAHDSLFGLYYSTNGSDFKPALTGTGITANAITDGNIYIVDTDIDGEGANGIFVRRRVVDEQVTFSSENPLGYVKLAQRNVEIKEVWNSTKTVKYVEGVDYAVNEIDGMIARVSGSSIPTEATVLVTYDWNVVDINSQFGVRVRGLIQVENEAGTTLIGGGFVRVQGLDVGVFMSDNFALNGDFTQTSTAWGTEQTNDGKSLPGYPEYPAGEPFFGDWYADRLGRFYRYGAAYWIPSKSDTTYDEHGDMTGYASVSFTPNDFLHLIYGYANLELGGETYQWAQIEQDIYPFLNYSDNPDHIIPAERFEDVVFSAGFHWHASHSSQNEIRLEVDELVPNYVFVEATRTSPFTPVWDNVHDEYEGITYGKGKDDVGWSIDDETFVGLATGDNIAYGKDVSSNGTLVPGTESYAVDNDFLREHWATKTSDSGHQYLQVDLGSAQPINEIRVWHSLQTNRRYRKYKLEVSEDGVVWETIYDTTAQVDPDPLYKEGQPGKTHRFATKNVRYIRDWIDGYEILDVQDQVIDTVDANQWIDIQVRYCAAVVTEDPGAYFEWEFTPKSRCDLWIGFVKGPEFGIASVEINGIRVSTIDQSVMIGSHDPEHHGDPHYHTAYIDVSSQEDLQIIPRKKHIVKVTFLDIPENQGKKFNFTRIKLEDFQTAFTTSQVIASDEIRPANPYGFYYPQITPNQARNYLGTGRQALKGMYDNPNNFSPSANVWLRYRFRIISSRQAGGDLHGHDHVMISSVTAEYGTKRTHFRRSSLDTTPSQFLQPWVDDDYLRNVTGVHEHHLADNSVTDRKIASVDWSKITNIPPDLGGEIPVMSDSVKGGAKLGQGLEVDQDDKLNVKWAGSGGNHGIATTVARSDHKHGWSEITNAPSSSVANIDDAVTKRHSQNTDTGTTSTTFGIATSTVTSGGIFIGGTTLGNHPHIRWNNSNTRWEFYSDWGNTTWSEVRASTFRNSSGTEVAYQGHNHNDIYYTKTNLQTSGQATVHWNNISNKPDFATRWPAWSEVTSKPFSTVGTGLTVTSNDLRVSFAGTGAANTVARSDHNHDTVYSKLSGSTITGAYTFTKDDGVALEISAANPNRAASQDVTFSTDTQELTHSPVVRGSVVVKNTAETVTYSEGDDYTIDYLNGTIERATDGDIASNQTVKVSYQYTREIFRTRTGGSTKFSIDSDGNIKGTSIVVQVQASEETSETSGSFTVDGDLTVTGSTTLGDDPTQDTTTITGGLIVAGSSGTVLNVTTAGNASLVGMLSVGDLQVDGESVVLDSDLQSLANTIYTKTDLANATAGTNVHWNTLTNLPAYATRWPAWTEVTSKPDTFAPSAHTHNANDINAGTLSYSRLPFSATDVSNWNTAYGWGDYRTYGLGTFSTVNSGTLSSLNSNCFFAHGSSDGDSDWNTGYGSYPVGIHWERSSTVQAQIALGYGSSGRLAFRNKISSGSWSSWSGVWHDGDFTSTDISNWNTAYNERRQWDGGSTNLNATTARTSLGLTGNSNTTHYHDGRYYTKTNLETSGQATVHWGNLSNVPNATTGQLGVMRVGTGLSVSSGIVSVNLVSAGEENGTSTQSARADHFHKGLEQIVGSGILDGVAVSATTPVSLTVNVAAGAVVLSDGYVLYTSGDTIDLANYVSGAGSRYVVVYVIGTKTSGTPFGVAQGPTDGTSLPALPANAIPLARVLLTQGANSISSGNIKDIRKFANMRWIDNSLHGYKDHIYNTSTNTAERRETAWSLDKDGRLTLSGASAGVSTDGGVTFVDVSTKAPIWDAGGQEAHKHVWNEIPTRTNATTYKLTYHVRVYDGKPAIQLFRRGLYMTPGVDYTITNDTIVFAESVAATDNVVANYVRV